MKHNIKKIVRQLKPFLPLLFICVLVSVAEVKLDLEIPIAITLPALLIDTEDK